MEEYGTFKAFGRLRSVLMHRPYAEFELIEDPSKWGFASKPNKDRAAKEFDALADLLKREGVDIHFIEIEETTPPNLYYTRDLGLCTKNGVVLANFCATYRQGEELYLQISADALEIPVFGEVRNAFFEGGDFVQISDSTAAVGLQRTSYSGYEELSEFADVELLPVPHEEEFAHLDTVFNMVREDLCVACKPALPREFTDFLDEQGIGLIDITLPQQRELSADVLMLEAGKVVISDSCAETIRALEKQGVEVLQAGLTELKKGKGGPGCLALTLLRK